jgi:hypothetical protein
MADKSERRMTASEIKAACQQLDDVCLAFPEEPPGDALDKRIAAMRTRARRLRAEVAARREDTTGAARPALRLIQGGGDPYAA